MHSAPHRQAIGIFDSGVGGLTVLEAIRHRFPHESFVYLGDTARLPYGTKSATTVQHYAVNAANHLLHRGIKLLIVACNTASSFALPELQASCDIPVIGVIEPGVAAALASGASKVGVIGTEGTIRSGAYQRLLQQRAPAVEVASQACPLFVPLAEEGWGDHEITDAIARHYLADLLAWEVETLILGCTHYPLLRPSLARVAGPNVQLVDSATSVAEALIKHHSDLLTTGHPEQTTVSILLSDASDSFLRVARAILGTEPENLELVQL